MREALALPLSARADIAAELLASLEKDSVENAADVEAAWAVEIERRATQVIAGESPGEAWEGVRERIARRLT